MHECSVVGVIIDVVVVVVDAVVDFVLTVCIGFDATVDEFNFVFDRNVVVDEGVDVVVAVVDVAVDAGGDFVFDGFVVNGYVVVVGDAIVVVFAAIAVVVGVVAAGSVPGNVSDTWRVPSAFTAMQINLCLRTSVSGSSKLTETVRFTGTDVLPTASST